MRKGVKHMKKIVAGFLTAVTILCGTVSAPVQVDAQETGVTTSTGVIYESMEMKDYWTVGEKKVPIKKDYVFGGWYTSTDGKSFKALKENDGVASENTYAKFVPAYVLSIKTQIEEGAAANDGKNTCLRLLSSVDSTGYREVGFEVFLGSRTKAEITPVITKVYQELKLNADDPQPIKPEEEFGAASDYFSALRITDITDKSDASLIYARPYWVTLDGTKVEGMAKYVRVEDGFAENRYISVPVNLFTGEEIAAGVVTMTYDAEKLEVVDVQTGRLLKEMEANVKENGIVKFAGNAMINADGTKEAVHADGLYANVRLKAKGAEADLKGLSFTMSNEDFATWNEEKVNTVKAWNVQY